jgi:hypothetical protein
MNGVDFSMKSQTAKAAKAKPVPQFAYGDLVMDAHDSTNPKVIPRF